ncbi:MAG: CorA family divalent cation transporter [Candidatus Pacearchaeota archaeon]
MIIRCENLEKLSEHIQKSKHTISLDKIAAIDYPFLDTDDTFTLLSVPSYHDQKNNIAFICEDTYILTPENIQNVEGRFKAQIKKKHGESTISILLLLKAVIKNYAQQFNNIRERMDELDLNPIIDNIEINGRSLRKLTDRIEALLHVILQMKEREIEAFDTKLISFEYEVLLTETRYWLERCRSHAYRIASLRTKSEMKANAELNSTMKKLTVITTFLSIAAIVTNIPGTIGAIFGIPALSDAYFTGHTTALLVTLVATTLLSIVLGFIYWKSLKLKSS